MAEPNVREKDIGDHTLGMVNGITALPKTLDAAGAGLKVAASTGIGAIPGIGEKIGGSKNVLDAVSGSVQESAKGITNIGWLTQLAVGAIAVVKGAQAVNDAVNGNYPGALGKVANGLVYIAATIGTVGLIAVPDLAAKLMTGESLTDRAANAAEQHTIKILGGGKEQEKKIADINAVANPASVAVMAGGMGTTLAANQITGANGQPLTVGALPGSKGQPITLPGQPVIPNQVMPVAYEPLKQLEVAQPTQITAEKFPAPGVPDNYWEDRVKAERQGRDVTHTTIQQPVMTSGGDKFVKAFEIAKQYAATQNTALTTAG
jgi:hypothetical protein